LWFSKIHAFFIEKDITADIVVKPDVVWKLVTFCVHHIQSHDTFIQYKPKMRFFKTCQPNLYQDVLAINSFLQFIPSPLRTSKLDAYHILHVSYTSFVIRKTLTRIASHYLPVALVENFSI
jgi:hypothetical protein